MPDEKLIDEQMEETRRQMDETRASLSAKLDTLETRVTETVQEASATVASATEVVTSVKETVQGAADAITNVTESVGNTVDSVKESVQETVQNVRDTVNESMAAVSDYLDLAGHVRNHPWPMMGGAVALGFLGGYALSSADEPSAEPSAASEPRSTPAAASARQNGHGKKHEPRPAPKVSWLHDLMRQFEPELEKVKYMAVGALVDIVHDTLAPSIPENFRSQFAEVLHDFTRKLTTPEQSANPPGKKKPEFSPEAHRFAG